MESLQRSCGVGVIVLALLFSLISCATSDDINVVYKRMYDSSMSEVSQEDYQDLLNLLQSDGSFSDLKYGKDNSHSFRKHGERQGALAYHHLKGKKDLKAEIESCFKYLTYDAPPNTDTSVFRQLILTPGGMWPGLVLANDILSKQLITDFLDRYWVNTKLGPVWTTKVDGNNAGGNFAPRGLFGEVEGLIRGTYKEVHGEVSALVHKEVALRQPYKGNGLRHDGCLHQHNPGGDSVTVDKRYLKDPLWNPYAGEYGRVFMKYMSLLMSWYAGTDLDFEDESVEGIYASYFECQQWIFRGQILEPTMCGRKITLGDIVTHFSTEGLIKVTGENLLAIGRHKDEVEAVLHRHENTLPDPKYALIGHRHFYYTDLSTHQRRKFYASVRVLSNRTVRPETWQTGENIEGYFQADGFMTVLVDGGEYGHKHNEVFQVYDWARVPSVTNQYITDIPGYRLNSYNSRHFFNDAKFAGGVTDGHVGVASMVYNRPHVPLTALKSWFFFDDVILVVGSGITLDHRHVTDNYVSTTLTQIVFDSEYTVCKKPGDEETHRKRTRVFDKPSWLFHRQVGYVFLNGNEHLHTSAETRRHDGKHMDVFTAWITHGKHPVNVALEYAVLPATTLQGVRDFAKTPTVRVIYKDKDRHAVCNWHDKIVAASLPNGGKVRTTCGGIGPIEIDVGHPCLFLAKLEQVGTNGHRISLSVSDPQHIYDTINVKVSLDGHQQEKQIQLPKDPHRGSSVTTIFEF